MITRVIAIHHIDKLRNIGNEKIIAADFVDMRTCLSCRMMYLKEEGIIAWPVHKNTMYTQSLKNRNLIQPNQVNDFIENSIIRIRTLFSLCGSWAQVSCKRVAAAARTVQRIR